MKITGVKMSHEAKLEDLRKARDLIYDAMEMV